MQTSCPPAAPSAPTKTFPGLLALPPTSWRSRATGERIRLQGSPGFGCVYVTVDEAIVAIPLDIAEHVGALPQSHASEALHRIAEYVQGVDRLS